MKKIAFLLMSVAVIALSSCSKEGERGPAGAQGPAGPAGAAGDDADFAINTVTVAAADFAGGTYVEYPAAFISEDLYSNGMAIAYVQDTFGYWNTIPSQWHELTDFGFFYSTADATGIIGFSADGGITADYPVRIVTMKRADYDQLNEAGLLANYNEVVKYLNK
ncbi:MAG: hypothetical protein ACOVMR_08520 [Flavobacteriales bacterium]